ncbi:DNA cytosine methyltransferase [Ferrimicrobium sp.]|uniref:DNA cytosine methyltransferase n=1 Tax=Ferrimicrobium sp. TaxID=2926050 RepID=UPI0026020216|nr:DNA cytosine methyltransferase [Ferrimicrobium sp.]
MTNLKSNTVLSGFSGVGGLDLGLEAAGFEHVGCIELDDAARQSLKANRGGQWPLFDTADIMDIAKQIRPIDVGLRRGELTLLAGAPPCQPFSKAAQWSHTSRIGIRDSRSESLGGFLNLVDIFLPEAILLENVTGFAQGIVAALPTIEHSLALINSRWGVSYRAEVRILDAAEFGVPQRRRRAIIVALREGNRFSWPVATHVRFPVRSWDALADVKVGSPPIARGKWADLLPSIPEGMNYLWHTARGGGRPIFGYRTRYWSFLLKLAKGLPSWTLAAQPGPATGPFHWDSRPLAVEEMLRLQSMPAGWIVEGTYRERVRQVGNATPSLLAELLGRGVLVSLGRSSSTRPSQFLIPRLSEIPEPEEVEPVKPFYQGLVAQHAEHPGVGLGPRPRQMTV